MPPPVVGFTSPAASPTTSSRSLYVRAMLESGRIFCRGGSCTSSSPQRSLTRPTMRAKCSGARLSAITPTRA